jgi:hypothetical protein
MFVVPDTQADTRICIGTDPHSLAHVGLLGWQRGYDRAREDAPHFRSGDARQQAAASSCQQCFTHYAPLDAITLQRAYVLGWHMGYEARVRGDAWITHRWLTADVIAEASVEMGSAPHG